jgi:hypothetical protein
MALLIAEKERRVSAESSELVGEGILFPKPPFRLCFDEIKPANEICLNFERMKLP